LFLGVSSILAFDSVKGMREGIIGKWSAKRQTGIARGAAVVLARKKTETENWWKWVWLKARWVTRNCFLLNWFHRDSARNSLTNLESRASMM
jgi:hypothetical protein